MPHLKVSRIFARFTLLVRSLTRLHSKIRCRLWTGSRFEHGLRTKYDYAKTLGILVTEYEIAAGNRVEVSLVGLALLKEIVQQSGVTQAKLASIMGIEQGTVSKIMTGARSITVDHAKRLAKHFKIRASALLEV